MHIGFNNHFWSRPGAEEQRRLQEVIRADAGINLNFVVLTLGAAAIATLGLLENNAAVIIGAMIIAPLILPIGSFSFAALDGDLITLKKAAGTLAVGAVLSVILAVLITRVFFLPTPGSEILARSQPNLLDLGVALAAGVITAFARIRPSVAGTIAGTAIAVALMPPICVVGIGMAHGMWNLALGAALLFATNFFGITLASMSVYVISGHADVRRAGHGLIWTALATAGVFIPLAVSTNVLIQKARVEATLRSALVNGTVTFHRAELISASFDWLTSPPEVHLLVRSRQPITPVQGAPARSVRQTRDGNELQAHF